MGPCKEIVGIGSSNPSISADLANTSVAFHVGNQEVLSRLMAIAAEAIRNTKILL